MKNVENQHEIERWYYLQSREGGNTQLKMHNKEDNKKNNVNNTVLCHRMSGKITLTTPRLGAEEGAGKTRKKKKMKQISNPPRKRKKHLVRALK